MVPHRFLFALVVCAAGCGPSVVTDGSSSGGSSTSGNGGAASTTTSNGGAAGSGGGEAGGIAGSFQGGAGGAIGPGGSESDYCAGDDFYFDISGDGPDQHYDVTCQPAGYLIAGAGPPPPPDGGPPQPPPGGPSFLQFMACSIMQTTVLLGSATMELPGSTNQAYIGYQSAVATASSEQGNVIITEFGDVGQPIVGEYSAIVSGSDPGSPTYDLSGTFKLCRTADVYLP